MHPQIFSNPAHEVGASATSTLFSAEQIEAAQRDVTSWPGYRRTPLVSLEAIARELDVKAVLYKDEGGRFGLGSFKALGGAFAVQCLLQRFIATQTGHTPSPAELFSGRYSGQGSLVVGCATDGNHGRSVAWAAQQFGIKCFIYVHSNVSESRRRTLTSLGAEVIVVPGVYDDAVRMANEDSQRLGWTVVSDTSYDGYRDIPVDVMRGYTVMLSEAMRQSESIPTHVFIQCGVGALPASVCAYFSERYGDRAPKLIVVEPVAAACLLESAKAGRLVNVGGDLATIMAGLACGHPSHLAWDILSTGATAFMTVGEVDAVQAVRLLHNGAGTGRSIIAGETGAAGFAGFLAASRSADGRTKLGLNDDSVVLVIGTESDTDPQLYQEIVQLDDPDIKAFCEQHLKRARALATNRPLN